jgi:hypothetical protein
MQNSNLICYSSEEIKIETKIQQATGSFIKNQGFFSYLGFIQPWHVLPNQIA